MRIYNNTSDEVLYTITAESGNSRGTIDPGETVEEPSYDNENDITVSFSNNDGGPFRVTIPKTRPGMAVTLGLFFNSRATRWNLGRGTCRQEFDNW
jgi:hypothetical protein